ncbi:MAG TPA: adenylate/guanylate cyclase domain-containing protein [Burkholderiales bacterium]|nr:adenylate/guanylate cyclase domain-containing protein [Burkholderiales bacterium]
MSEPLAPKAGDSSRTLVCSVLFLDIAGYSRLGVSEQIRLKQKFNEVLAGSLADLEARDRIVIDTGDGAAIAFLDDPERALFAAVAIFDNVGELPVRMGINLGPVYLSKDINGQDNVIGDGINVAQRVMSFAQKGELLVSRSFYEVVLLLSGDYASMFQARAAQTDKHNRSHELYAVSEAVRVGRRVAETQAKRRLQRPLPAAAGPASTQPATVSDAGSHFLVSGSTRESVEAELARFAADGANVIAAPAQVGARWMATFENRRRAVRVSVEKLGMKTMVSASTREAVDAKVAELVEYGARLAQEVEQIDGMWTAVLDDAS